MQVDDLDISHLRLHIIRAYQVQDLRGIKMMMPALCRIRRGTKVVQWGSISKVPTLSS